MSLDSAATFIGNLDISPLNHSNTAAEGITSPNYEATFIDMIDQYFPVQLASRLPDVTETTSARAKRFVRSMVQTNPRKIGRAHV